ncbi:MAG: glutaconate CoA-transferase, subunit [Thermodesulfobacteriota bacterium]|nr:glutaconate CoA-transferase, subunit [Thermodesulfobacteriota bacterium]
MSLSEAIKQYVPDGAEAVMGTSLETLIPFAAGHEIIRQRKKNLTLIGPISDILFDMLIGAGCVRKTRAAWIGNVITGSSYNFRRAAEEGTLETEDHSNLTISMALKAGAMGVPFMPAFTALGSDLYKTNQSLKKITCPFTGILLTAVSAINPDVAIIHAQRSDEYGNAHLWGNLGVTREACLSSRHIIITAEEIVSPYVIESDPNRVITPGFRVNAVVHVPWGAHPSPVPGYYNRDHDAFIEYRNDSKTPEVFEKWLRLRVDNIKNSDDYLRLLGKERISKLKLRKQMISEPVNYGY